MSDSEEPADAVVTERSFAVPVNLIWHSGLSRELQGHGTGLMAPQFQWPIQDGRTPGSQTPGVHGKYRLRTADADVVQRRVPGRVENERLVYTESVSDQNGDQTRSGGEVPGSALVSRVSTLLTSR
jgi:hypothetical protein